MIIVDIISELVMARSFHVLGHHLRVPILIKKINQGYQIFFLEGNKDNLRTENMRVEEIHDATTILVISKKDL